MEHISTEQKRIRLMLLYNLHHLIKHVCLFLIPVYSVKGMSQMPVTRMYEFHICYLRVGRRHCSQHIKIPIIIKSVT